MIFLTFSHVVKQSDMLFKQYHTADDCTLPCYTHDQFQTCDTLLWVDLKIYINMAVMIYSPTKCKMQGATQTCNI